MSRLLSLEYNTRLLSRDQTGTRDDLNAPNNHLPGLDVLKYPYTEKLDFHGWAFLYTLILLTSMNFY